MDEDKNTKTPPQSAVSTVPANETLSSGDSSNFIDIKVKCKYLVHIKQNVDKLCELFNVKVIEIVTDDDITKSSDNVAGSDLSAECIRNRFIRIKFQLIGANNTGNVADDSTNRISTSDQCSSGGVQQPGSAGANEPVVPTEMEQFKQNICQQIYQFIETTSHTEAEDSSYDSDCDVDEFHNSQSTNHEQVSRTTSDTLGQEFAEYVCQPVCQDRSPGYKQRVEFALKLGYTERLVQAAITHLGQNPSQNELLAELIRLGTLQGNKGEFTCDSPTADCMSPGIGGGNNNGICAGPSGGLSIVPKDNGIANNALRPIVIDGSNVAMSHGNKEVFSCRGIKICVDWFKARGHKEITVFVPKWRKENSRPDNPIIEQDILSELEKERMLVFTPSRLLNGKRMVCYDDRYILKLAVENDGIIVSNDNYRDLIQESNEFKKVIEERVLMYSFVNDRFMPPDDPLGRSGPTLSNFLKMQPTCRKGDQPACPYGKKCTYGNKCKFNHPERGIGPHKTVTERLSEHAARHLQARNANEMQANRVPIQGKSLSVPLNVTNCEPLSIPANTSPCSETRRKPIFRTRSGVSEYPYNPHLETHMSQQQLNNMSYVQQSTPSPNSQQTQHINWDTSPTNLHPHLRDGFPKSISIDNISREAYSHAHPHFTSIWQHSPVGQNPQQQQQQQQQPGTIQSQQANELMEDSVNLHQKLKRQLSLNPSGCDPRIYQMQQRHIMHPSISQSQAASHRALASSLSGGPRSPHSHQMSQQWDAHQSVTRNASAPDPARPWCNGPPPASSSEPHISNLWSQQQIISAGQTQHMNMQEARRKIHYHLTNVFPEEQVQTVMQLYPEETNPQKICAVILSMYPPKN